MRIAALAFVLIPCFAQEQEEDALFRRAGKLDVQNHVDRIAVYGLGAEGSKAFLARLQSVSNLFASTRVMANPRGFEGYVVVTVDDSEDACGSRGCRTLPPNVRIRNAIVYDFRGGNGEVISGLSNTNAFVSINDFKERTWRDFGAERTSDLIDTRGNRILTLPAKTRNLGGHPLYGERFLVVARASRRLFLPVSGEQYLQALIARKKTLARTATQGNASGNKEIEKGLAEARAALADLRKLNPAAAAETERQLAEAARQARQTAPAMERFNSSIQAEIAACEKFLLNMNSQARASQAWIAGVTEGNPAGLVPAESSDAQPAVILNPDYFDPARRAEIQIVLVDFRWGAFNPETDSSFENIQPVENVGDYRLKQLIQQVDWKQLAAVVNGNAR